MIDFSKMKELSIGGVKLRELSVDGTKVWQAGRLPAGYTEREYIRFDGASWLNTRINPADYPAGIEYHFKGRYLEQNATNDYLWGCLVNNRRSGNVAINRQAGGTVLYLSNSSNILKKAPLPEYDTFFEIYLRATPEDTLNTVFEFNGEKIGNERTQGNSNMPDGEIYLGYCPNVGSTSKPFIGDMCPYTLINPVDGSMILDYVSCTRDSDGAAGMFDLVTSRFDTNAGTGTLTAGPAV